MFRDFLFTVLKKRESLSLDRVVTLLGPVRECRLTRCSIEFLSSRVQIENECNTLVDTSAICLLAALVSLEEVSSLLGLRELRYGN